MGVDVFKVFNSNGGLTIFYSVYLGFINDLRRDNNFPRALLTAPPLNPPRGSIHTNQTSPCEFPTQKIPTWNILAHKFIIH